MIQADFEKEEDVKKTAEQTLEKFNQVDVLVRLTYRGGPFGHLGNDNTLAK